MVGAAAPEPNLRACLRARSSHPNGPPGCISVGVGARRSAMPLVVWLMILALVIAAALWWFVL
jgi:hypothetical protein